MRPELLAAKSRVDDDLRELDLAERSYESVEDVDHALEQVRAIDAQRVVLIAQRKFLERVIDKEHERDRVDTEMRARHEEEDKREAAEAAAAARNRRSEDKPLETSGFPGPGTWPTDVRR